jgi:exopolysaccharide production protein ExoY
MSNEPAPTLNPAIPLIEKDNLEGRQLELGLKRFFDVVVSSLALVALLPVFAIVALAIRITSPGPIIFQQRREGYQGHGFLMLKFRSMKVRHDEVITQAQQESAERGQLIKMHGDPRITRVGRFLRRTSLDELPQLINVLKGEMSLIGPRPLLPFMLEPHPEFREARAQVRPGITGLWQIRDRENNTNALSMLPHDLEYIHRFSLWLDLSILLSTVGAVLSRRGAC